MPNFRTIPFSSPLQVCKVYYRLTHEIQVSIESIYLLRHKGSTILVSIPV